LLNGRLESAHRAAYLLFVGPIPEGKLVLHRCDRKLCVKPQDLFLGTPADNTADMMAKGRHRTGPHDGANNPNAKLSEADVSAIRRRAASGETSGIIALDYPQVSRSTVARVIDARGWTTQTAQAAAR
jgi:CTP:molybdopterin cytidylyltransferase MocA